MIKGKYLVRGVKWMADDDVRQEDDLGRGIRRRGFLLKNS